MRDEYMAALRLLHAYRRGDAGALDELRARENSILRSRIPEGKLSEAQFEKLDNDLADWIIEAGAIRKEFESDVADYEKARAELDRIEATVIADLAIARLQFATWARSHQALANGVRDPAKWMDLTLKAAGAVKAAL